MANIIPIPALKDNYIWLIQGKPSQVAIVDPGEAKPVIESLRSQNLKLEYILITHHHWDHTSGIPALKLEFPKVTIFGPANSKISHITHPVSDGDNITLEALDLSFEIMAIPGHTLDHIAYYNENTLFCGDTLFLCGCGRVFEGTIEQMYESLKKLKSLNDNLQVYCGHEYTQANLDFCLSIEPNNPALQHKMQQIQKKGPHYTTVPERLGLEKKCNPFLRCDDPILMNALAKKSKDYIKDSPLETFRYLRALKDQF